MKRTMDGGEFLNFCEKRTLHFKRMRRDGFWMIVACADEARREELAQSRLLSLEYKLTYGVNDNVISIENGRAMYKLGAYIKLAVHATSLRDFLMAYSFTPLNEAIYEFRKVQFEQHGHVIIGDGDCTQLAQEVGYFGPFYGADTEWWFGKGVI